MSAPTSTHPGLQVALVLGLDRVGRVVRERAVELAVHDLELERQALEHRRDDQAAHAVGGVGHDLAAAQRVDVDERAHVVGERRRAGPALDTVPRAPRPASSTPGRDQLLDLAQAGVLADRRGAGAGSSLMPLYWAGLCDGGEHRAGRVERARRRSRRGRSRPGRGRPRRRPRACAPSAKAATSGTADGRMSRPDDDRSTPPVNRAKAAPMPGDGRRRAGRDDAADVVGLEDGVERIAHDRASRAPHRPRGGTVMVAPGPAGARSSVAQIAVIVGVFRWASGPAGAAGRRRCPRATGPRAPPRSPAAPTFSAPERAKCRDTSCWWGRHHQVGAEPPRAVRPVRLPVGEVRGPDDDRDTGPRTSTRCRRPTRGPG